MDSGPIEEQMSIMAAERGCDREADYEGCESCAEYEDCHYAAYLLALFAMKPPSSEE